MLPDSSNPSLQIQADRNPEADVDRRPQGENDIPRDAWWSGYIPRHAWWSGGVLHNEHGTIKPVYLGSKVSIESVELKIKTGAGDTTSHEIYGKIMVQGRRGTVYAVYHREENRPEIIQAGQPYDLTLSGPKYSLRSNYTHYLYVRLYEKGSDTQLLNDNICFLSGECRYRGENEAMRLFSTGDRASLTVNFTRFCYSVLARVSIDAVSSTDQARWTVSGTVKAIQSRPVLIGEPPVETPFERVVTLFRSTGIRVSSGEAIPLDRNVVVTPVQFGVVGPSLAIEVDLCFVERGSDTVNKVNWRKEMVWTPYHCLEHPFRETIDLKDVNGGPDRLDVVVAPFSDLNPDLSDEEDERDYE